MSNEVEAVKPPVTPTDGWLERLRRFFTTGAASAPDGLLEAEDEPALRDLDGDGLPDTCDLDDFDSDV